VLQSPPIRWAPIGAVVVMRGSVATGCRAVAVPIPNGPTVGSWGPL